MRPCFIFIFLAFTVSVAAQPSDFIILKKGNKKLRTYFAGSNIQFVTVTGAYRDGLINRISRDSIYVEEFMIRQLQTRLGFYILDTAGSFHYIYHINQIKSIGKEQRNFNWRGSGAALLGGGTLLTLGSGVMYLADREKFSPGLMAASAGLAGLGYLMAKKSGSGITLGRKGYRLQYMNVQ